MFLGEEVVLHDVASKVVMWVDRFVTIGDTVVQYDPGHAALPWATFKFLLQVVLSDERTMGEMLVGLEKVGALINRCAVYEQIFHDVDYEAVRNLEEALLRLYVAIVRFLLEARTVYGQNGAGEYSAHIHT